MSAKRPKHPALKPHTEGDYLEEVVVLRIPVGTPPAERSKALEWQHNKAKKISESRKDIWWMNERKGNDSWS